MKRTRLSHATRLVALVTLVIVGGSCELASARSIGVYFDAAGTICKGRIEPGTQGTLYIVMRFDDDEGGAAGAEFRFSGVPDGWATFAVPNANMLAIGDPLRNGIVAGFGACMGVTREPYVLYTVLVNALSPAEDLEFEVGMRIPPSNHTFTCPIAVACDAPVFTAYCIRNVKCQVNSRRPGTCAAPTAVAASSWSAVKELYRGQ